MMKKLRYYILALLLVVGAGVKIYTTDAAGIPVGSTNLTYQTCLAFADVFKTISTSSGSYYYRYCYRATCSGGVYNKANMVSNSGYRCQNGNYDPYTKISSDGCANYMGTCSTPNSTYCTRVTYIDCNKTSKGEVYENETTTTRKVTTRTTPKKTTTKTTTTKKVFTTVTKSSTKKTTTKKKTTTTTKFQPGVIVTTTKPTTTVSTTTTTTVAAVINDTGIKKIVADDFVIQNKDKTPLIEDSYSLDVPYGVNDIEIKVTLVDKKATYKIIGNTNMPEDGEHKIQIEVTAQDGVTKRTVVLDVKRYEMKDNNCYLHSISSEDVAIEFSKKQPDYEVKIGKNVKSLDLKVAVLNDKQTYSIKGNEGLKNNSVIEIEVIAEDGTECLYSIKVKKPSNAWKYIIIIVLLIGIICGGVYFFFKYLKKSKGTYKYE